jgi:hypothetical protein
VIWQKRCDEADCEGANRSRSNPSVPKHLGREKIQDRIGNVSGTMRAEKKNALRGINRKQREPASPRNNIEERESCPVAEGKPAERRREHYHPKPPMLFMM